ncbi:hypothetical protein AB0J43_05360 [Nonomuraea fuscirosea]
MSVLSRYREVEAACKRLAPKFGDEAAKSLAASEYGYALPPVKCVVEVAKGVRRTAEEETKWALLAAPEDVDDALLVSRSARTQIMEDELALIERARANGRSWERIAELLGVSEAAAKGRPAALRRAIADLDRI